MGLDFDDFKFGYNVVDTKKNFEELNTKAIIETKRLLNDLDGIKSSFNEGWIGIEKDKFITDLEETIKEVQEQLDNLEEVLYDLRRTIKSSGTGIVRMEQALFGVVTTILVLCSLLVLSWILWSV